MYAEPGKGAIHGAKDLRHADVYLRLGLIVEEIGLRKNRTVLTESRTLRVDRSGNVLFDSIQQGMDDAYGCLMDGDCIALLRRTAWELQILSAAGSVRHRIDLSTLTRHLPNLVSWTPCNTFLIACQDHVYDTDLLEIDSLGRLLWFLPKKDAIGCATAAQLVDDELILVADEFGHVAMEIRRDGLSATRKVSFGAISTERGKDKLRR